MTRPVDDLLRAQLDGEDLDEPAPHAIPPGRATCTARLLPRSMMVYLYGEPGGGGVRPEGEAAVSRALGSSGAPLPDDMRARFEASLAADLGGVRVHTGADSAAAARAVGARAYTLGQDIHFAAGAYAPGDPFGVHLLAHEVAHTVQQAGGAPVRQHKLEVSSPGDAAEVEADRAADAMVSGAGFAIGGASATVGRVVMRKPGDQADGDGAWHDVKVKAPTTLADRTDGSAGTVNLLGKDQVLAIGTVVQTSGKTAVGGAWTEIRLSDDPTKVGWVLSKVLDTGDAAKAPADGAAPAAPAPAPAASGGGGAKGHTTKPTTVSSKPAPDAANVLGDGKVLPASTPLDVTGAAIPIAGDPQKRSWLPIAVGDGDFAGKAGFILSDCAEVEAAPPPKQDAPKDADKDAPAAPPPAPAVELPFEIRASTGDTAAVNTSVDYTLIIRQTSLNSSPMISWYHFKIVDGALDPVSKHGFPGHGEKHSHLWEEVGQFKVVATIGTEDSGDRAEFTQTVVAADDKDSPLEKGKAAANTSSAEDWLANRDKKPDGPAPQAGPIVSSANPCGFGADISYDVTAADGAKTFHWYVVVDDPDGFLGTSDDRERGVWFGEWMGLRKYKKDGKSILDGGDGGTHFVLPSAQGGTYTVVCEEKGADGSVVRTDQLVQTVEDAHPKKASGPSPQKKQEFVDDTNDALAKIADEDGKKKAVGVKATYLAQAGGKAFQLVFYIGPKKDGGGLVLIDLQPGVSTRAYEGATTDACFSSFSSIRSYPNGRIAFHVDARPDWGVDAFDKTIEVEPSKTDKAIAIVGQIAGLAAGPLLFIAPPLGAVFTIIAAAADMHDAYKTGQFVSERTAIDVMNMAMSLVPLGEALESALIAERLPDVAGKVGKYVRIVGYGSGVAGGVMMEQQAIKRLSEINASGKSPEEKQHAMAEALLDLVQQTVLLAIVLKGAAEAGGKEPPAKKPGYEVPGWGKLPDGTPELGTKASVEPGKLAPTEDVATKIGGPEKVNTLAEKMKKGYDGPPIKVVIGPDGTYYVIDGHHRLAAAKKAGLSSVPIEVVDPRTTQFKDWKELKTAAANPGAPEGGHVSDDTTPAPDKTDPPPQVKGPDGNGASTVPPAEAFLAHVEEGMTPEEKAKLAQMKGTKTPDEARAMFGDDVEAAREKVRAAVKADQDRAGLKVQSSARIDELRKQITDRGLLNDPDVKAILDRPGKAADKVPPLRDTLMAKILHTEASAANPHGEVLSGVKVYEKMPEPDRAAYAAAHPGAKLDGLTERPDGLYLQRGELDQMVIERPAEGGKAKIISREEIKTGTKDTAADANSQLTDQSKLFAKGADGSAQIRLESGGTDITSQIDLGSDATATKSTRGPAGKAGFDESLGATAQDLEAMCKDLVNQNAAPAAGTQ